MRVRACICACLLININLNYLASNCPKRLGDPFKGRVEKAASAPMFSIGADVFGREGRAGPSHPNYRT